MKKISITDITLRRASEGGTLGFKEKLEIAKALDRLNVSAIELAPLGESKADSIFVKTLASLIHNTALALPVGLTEDGAHRAWEAVSRADRPRLIVDAPVSSVQMEYIARKKPEAMLETIRSQVALAVSLCRDVEFCATDASRAETDFLCQAIDTAIRAGAGSIAVCDTAGILLPEEFGAFLRTLYEKVPALKDVFVKVVCDDSLELAGASAVRALREGASGVKSCLIGTTAPQLKTICGIVQHKGDALGLYTAVKTTELNHTLQRILRVIGAEPRESASGSPSDDDSVTYDVNDSIAAVSEGIRALGYDLSEEELAKVYEEFLRLAAKKPVSRRELDAIVATSAMQVPATYLLESYVINSGNIITNTACLRLSHDGVSQEGISTGDGPIDAAFKAMESVTGRHYELDDFHIDALTVGKEAIGRAVVRLRSEGRLYSGSGVSTDIVSAAIRAYLGALNKIVYEEMEQ
ncbi:MAG: hypothetical protein IJ157_03365 [Clostridia bacterium]|nr:hypothetical protein [Clostridia bacterium]